MPHAVFKYKYDLDFGKIVLEASGRKVFFAISVTPYTDYLARAGLI